MFIASNQILVGCMVSKCPAEHVAVYARTRMSQRGVCLPFVQDSSGKYLQPEGGVAASERESHFASIGALASRLASSSPDTDALPRLLTAITNSTDPVLQHLVFRELIAAGHGNRLVTLAPGSMALERHLLALGHDRPYVIPWAELGQAISEPLQSGQLVHMELLKDLYVAQKELVRATQVLVALGHAHMDPSVEAVARPDRVWCFADAIVHVRPSFAGSHFSKLRETA
jgi:hypothetical protein